MKRQDWLDLGPRSLMGAGVLISTYIGARAVHWGWLVLAGPLFLALVIIAADLWDARLGGESSRPSAAALIAGASIVLAGGLVILRDPNRVLTLLPVLGGASGASLLWRSQRRPAYCRWV